MPAGNTLSTGRAEYETRVAPSEVPLRRPDWTHRPADGLWINWTALSADGGRLLAGTYHAGRHARYGTYCYDRTGRLLWKDMLPKDAYCGVFWVALSSDGAYGASGGWLTEVEIPHLQGVYLDVPVATAAASYYEGFIRAYRVEPFEQLLNYRTGSRVNTVVLTDEGKWLVAGSGDRGGRDNSVYLFSRAGTGYELVERFDAGPGAGVGSIAVSENGAFIVAGDGAGVVHLFSNDGSSLKELGRWQAPGRYIQLVAMTPDGRFFVASDSDGHFFCFGRDDFQRRQAPLWTYETEEPKNVYGVTISSDGRRVAASSNVRGGTIYLVRNTPDEAVSTGYRPELAWTFRTQRPPSPSVTMDRAGRFLTVADGYPLGQPGHYYLLDAASGRCLWAYATANMNWPMVISADGTAIFAGSDDAHVYFFANPS